MGAVPFGGLWDMDVADPAHPEPGLFLDGSAADRLSGQVGSRRQDATGSGVAGQSSRRAPRTAACRLSRWSDRAALYPVNSATLANR
jgi:hypothetical protein